MSKSSAGQWVKFFNASGIPSPAAATYAHIFVENRIQTDMLMDLNKEYLREMGINPMGDIIAILRHAKHVNDQTAREKVLSFESPVPIAAVSPANPILPDKRTATTVKLKQTVTPSIILPTPNKPRRVLPEHEGKYKIKLPSGTTKRSKEIMDKHAKLYSDREKSCVFQRLKKNSPRISGESDSGSSDGTPADNGGPSIFARLGGKANGPSTKEIKPILKKTTDSYPSRIVTAKKIPFPAQEQQVILVKKVPIKGSSDEDTWEDANDDDMDCDYAGGNEKIVKFASTAEVREIASVVHRTNNGKWRKSNAGGASDHVKARLGLSKTMHHTKRNIHFKATNAAVKPTIRRMKSELLDRQDLPVHKRLGGKERRVPATATSTVPSLSKRIGKLSLTNPHHTRNISATHAKSQGSTSRGSASVFDRLGFSK